MKITKINFNDPLKTPVLLLVFNRPDKTRQVFDVIKQVKPQKLYIAADGPRPNRPEDEVKCREVKEIVSQIDWECEPKFLFHEENLGVSLSGVTAWNWVFSFEEEMIFLEDDSIPSKSFFYFCQILLEKYRDTPQIGYICGQNFGKKYGNATYFFTRYGGGTWGLATWKRIHELYEYNMESYNDIKKHKSFKSKFLYHFEYLYWKRKFDNYIKNGGPTYDLQIGYSMFKNNLYSIMPNINMVTDIGWGSDATNLKSTDGVLIKKYGNLPRFELNEILHPEEFKIDLEFEREQLFHRIFHDKPKYQVIFENYFSLLFRVFRKFRKLVRRFIGKK